MEGGVAAVQGGGAQCYSVTGVAPATLCWSEGPQSLEKQQLGRRGGLLDSCAPRGPAGLS